MLFRKARSKNHLKSQKLRRNKQGSLNRFGGSEIFLKKINVSMFKYDSMGAVMASGLE